MNKDFTVGSVCSGIEAASVAWKPLGFNFKWFSEIAKFPSKLLDIKYPDIPNVGDMCNIPLMIDEGKIGSPDMIVGGTPCQAFSLCGSRKGLDDSRGNLTLTFLDIVESNDKLRKKNDLDPTIVFWENVEGVLSDPTNAFDIFISKLAGFEYPIGERLNVKLGTSGLVKGAVRNVAWRVLDSKFFGVPQQRRRVYVLAGGKNFYPEQILFEEYVSVIKDYPQYKLTFTKDNHKFEMFKPYTNCLCATYVTKWNGNASGATNGTLFVVQDNRLRRFTVLEQERLMGFPDNYTDIDGGSMSSRGFALGNSWTPPVISWIGKKNYKLQPNER